MPQASVTPAPSAPQAPVIATPVAGPDASAIYNGLRFQRRELQNQIDNLEGQRENIARELRDPGVASADKQGLEQRLKTIDQRLVTLDLAKAEADAAIAKQAAVPGAIQPDPPRPIRNGPPEEAFVLTGVFFVVVLMPLSVAFARRIWRRGSSIAQLPQEIYDRFTRVEQSIDAIALEVERVGEGQRFLTRMQAQQAERALGAGPAAPVDAGARERQTAR